MTVSTYPRALDWFGRTGQRGGQGHFRWAVKTASDPAAAQIPTTNPTTTTVADLTAAPLPDALVGMKETPPGPDRTAGVESTLYTLDTWLLRYHPETDGDYHLVLGDQQGHTMIAEIPDPARVDQGSPFYARIARARTSFEQQHPEARDLSQVHHGVGTPALVEINEQVTLTGIGFFDFIHGQDGVAPNGIELHPVVDIAFKP